mmetsp:Transcript_15776/g.26016  ORF Transcript_15776/g.26016 Transcript_15776/m.26016 type:complete len:534 (-) Transcript_15776:251-1852(-)
MTLRWVGTALVVLAWLCSICIFIPSSVRERQPAKQETGANNGFCSSGDRISERDECSFPHIEEAEAGVLPFLTLFPRVEQVPIIIVDIHEQFAEEIFEDAEPVIIRNSKATQWPAMKLWSPEYFIKHMEDADLEVHASAKAKVRMHTEAHPIGQLKGVQWNRPWANATVTVSEFFFPPSTLKQGEEKGDDDNNNNNNNMRSSNGQFYYFFSPMAAMPKTIQRDVGDKSSFVARFRPHMETNLWMATRGVGSPLHYDVAHNMYTQISGRKRFRLFPPHDYSNVYLYPRVHPSTRMSQVDMDSVRTEIFPRFLNTTPIEFTLEKGDVLYIPPYWLHQTEVAGAHSISVSVCSESPQVELRERVFLDQKKQKQLASLASPQLPLRVRVLALEAYMRAFFQTEYARDRVGKAMKSSEDEKIDRLRRFCSLMLTSRFDTLPFDKEVVGLSRLIADAKVFFQRELAEHTSHHAHTDVIEMAKYEGEKLTTKYNFLTGTMYRYTKTEWEIELMNHFEDVISMVLGSPLMIAPFLRYASTH